MQGQKKELEPKVQRFEVLEEGNGSLKEDMAAVEESRRRQARERMYLAHVKQFCNYYMVIADKLKMSYEMSSAGEFDELITKDELDQIDKTKDLFNRQYQSMLLDHKQSILPFLDLVLVEVIDNDTVPTNLLKVTIKILTRVFELVDPQTNLVKNQLIQKDSKIVRTELYDPSYILQSLMSCQIDDHSNDIDQQELIWINIQKLILQIIKSVPCSDSVIKQVFQFFQRLLENRGFQHNTAKGQTEHFSEKVKKNMNKLYKFLIIECPFQGGSLEKNGHQNQQPSSYMIALKDTIVNNFKIIDAPIELNENQQPVMTQAQKNKENEKLIKAIAFSITVLEEVLHNLCLNKSTSDFSRFLAVNFDLVLEMVSLCCEQKEKIVQLQAQQLFLFLVQQILQLRLPLREQFEILYVKCALKPVIQRIEYFEQLRQEVVQQPGSEQASQKPSLQLSDDEDDQNQQEAKQAVGKSKGPDAKTQLLQEDCQVVMSLSFLLEVLLSMRPEDIGILYLIYDCQQFSESIITKSLNLLLRYTKNDGQIRIHMYERLFQGLGKIKASTLGDIDGQTIYVTNQRLKYMLEQKSNQKTLARLCNEKPKLFLNKCQEIYKYIDEDAPWDIASKILLYSRLPIVEHITEIIGGKEQRNAKIFSQFLQKQDFKDGNLEQCVRRFMQTFRLAGVESQVVLRVMEGFSYEYFKHDAKNIFKNKEEAYEMAYLIIVLQTTMHNPSIKQKLRVEDFIAQAKACCPQSYDKLPDNFMNDLYENVKYKELFSPISRDWYHLNFNEADLNLCKTKLSLIKEDENQKVDQTMYVSTADLTQKQLFQFNNEIDAIVESDQRVLVLGALRHIVSLLSKRFLSASRRRTEYEHGVLKKIMEVNKKLLNYDFTDKILRQIYLINQSNESLINEIIKNFEMGAKNTVTLIPQIIMSKGIRHTASGTLLNKFGIINQSQLLEICQASERYFRKKHVITSTQLQRQILQLEGKTSQQIEEELKKNQGLLGMPGGPPSIKEESSQQSQSTASSLVNIVFNYFNEQQESISGPKDEANREKYILLKKQAESIKTRQIEQMKYMNLQFATLIRNNTSKGAGGNSDLQIPSGIIEEQELQFDNFVSQQIATLLPKILMTLKDNLFKIIKSQDGLFSLLFINNAVKQIMEELDQQRQRKDSLAEESSQQRTLDTIWQEMHLIMSKLTSTNRKVVYLKRTNQRNSITRFDEVSDQMNSPMQHNDFDDLSSLDSSFRSSDDHSFGGSSARSQEAEKIVDLKKYSQEALKKSPEFENPCTNATQKRVYQALCKHLILEIFFNINAFQIELISGINNYKHLDVTQQIQSSKSNTSDHGGSDLFKSQGNSTAISNSEMQASANCEGSAKDIQECMREIWRVFKSIVQGPSQLHDQVDSDEDIKIHLDGYNSIFDDLHVIIVINKLLQIEQKIDISSQEDNQNLGESSLIAKQDCILPINNYNKIYKFLRNLIIHSSATIEEIQMEVYAQNSDAFVNLIGICLKYIRVNSVNQKHVPFDLIGLINDLISKIAKKSKQMQIEIDVCQFIHIYKQLFSILMIQNSFELWLETISCYQQVVIFNNSLLNGINCQQTQKHAFLTLKEFLVTTKLSIYASDHTNVQQSQTVSPDLDQHALLTPKLCTNLTTTLNKLIFDVSFDSFIQGLQMRQTDLQNDGKIQRLIQMCDLFLEVSTDVFVVITQMLLEAHVPEISEDKQDLNQKNVAPDHEMFKLFQSFWFSYLKQHLAYLKRLEPLNISIQKNIKRVLVILVSNKRLHGPRADQEGTRMFKMWKKSWDAIQSFYPDMKNEVSAINQGQ